MPRIKEHPILEFKKGSLIKFRFEGKELIGFEGDTIASALHASGIKVYRKSEKLKRPRGFFCAIGRCSSCYMVVDGIPNVQTCVTPLKEGMEVFIQDGKGKLNIKN